jgi:hypothetical protein
MNKNPEGYRICAKGGEGNKQHMLVSRQSRQGYMRRPVIVAVRRQLSGGSKERFKFVRLLVRLQAAQVAIVDRESTAFAYNLTRNVRPWQAGNRSAENLMAFEDTS